MKVNLSKIVASILLNQRKDEKDDDYFNFLGLHTKMSQRSDNVEIRDDLTLLLNHVVNEEKD